VITLDDQGQFTDGVKSFGIFAKKRGKRWQYRDSEGKLYASGMTPAAFAMSFWYRDDWQEPTE